MITAETWKAQQKNHRAQSQKYHEKEIMKESGRDVEVLKNVPEREEGRDRGKVVLVLKDNKKELF